MRTDISHDPATNGANGADGQTNGLNGHAEDSYDVVIIGAGFAGCYLLYHLRKRGFKVRVVEAGADIGGIWYWNSYPGARVDTQTPLYAYSLPEVYETWTWSSRYPDWKELREYFKHIDKVLDVKKDVTFNTKITAAEFDEEKNRWAVHSENGKTIYGTWFIAATGFAAKRVFPDWKGMDTFKGVMHHSSFWPEEGVETKGKRVGVIGTGATGVQISQECAKDAAELTVFQRTPNLALPMRQQPLSAEEQKKALPTYPDVYKHRITTFGGFQFDFVQRKTLDDTPEQREALYEQLWEGGGFRFWLATYKDMLYEKPANNEAYKFWCKKVRARIHDKEKADILAPLEAPHAFGTKRPSLEQDYYDQFNKPNVHVIDIKANPVKEVVPEGIVTSDGKLHKLDVIALATGFDSITGGLKDIAIRSTKGELLADKWRMGTFSYLGLCTADFPNFLFLYGPQGPTAFSNGPSCVEAQGDWIIDVITDLRDKGLKRLNPTPAAEIGWREKVQTLSDETLFPTTNSWYMGANVPGKPRENLSYAGGIPKYIRETRGAIERGYEGFVLN